MSEYLFTNVTCEAYKILFVYLSGFFVGTIATLVQLYINNRDDENENC